MKYRKFRGALALLLVLSLFVSVCGLTAFADDGALKGPGVYDAMNKIRAIIILNHSFDARGGEVPGRGETFT
nr:hypothetical protein [Oscillospiraceae bacterium]